jgi:gas vesicle protein
MKGDNKYENRGTECAHLTREAGQKLMFLMIGGGIGAALALLFAPKSGRELRSDIAGMAETGYDETIAAANRLKETSFKYFEAAKETGSEVLDVVTTAASALKTEVRKDMENIGAIVEDSAKRAARTAKSMNVG